MSSSVPSTTRVAVFDGVRGIALVLIVLSHAWNTSPWMLERMYDATEGSGGVWSRLLGHLFSAGNYAVSIFFVVGAFGMTRALLARAESPDGLRPGRAVARRFIRLSGQLYFMLLVLLVITALAGVERREESTGRSVLHAATYTWNWFVHDHLELARADIGHLWYLSVDFQMFLIVLGLVWCLHRRRGLLVLALGGLWVALLVWRVQIYDYDPFLALLRTWARGDAPVAGALAAAALPYLTRRPDLGRPLATVGAVSLLPLLFLTHGSDAFFSWPGAALDVALAMLVLGCSLAPVPRALAYLLAARPLVFLGRHSLSVFLWHLPVIHFVGEHLADWREPLRLLVALVLTIVLATISELLVERRVRRVLDAPQWQAELRTLVRPLRVTRAGTGPTHRDGAG